MKVKYYSQEYSYNLMQKGDVTTVRFTSSYPVLGGKEVKSVRVVRGPSGSLNKYDIFLHHDGKCLIYGAEEGLPRMNAILRRIIQLDKPINWSEQGMQQCGVAHMITGTW